jgi:hypothetical protein
VKGEIHSMTSERAKRNEETRVGVEDSSIRLRVKSRVVLRLQSAWRSSVIRLRVKSRAVLRLQSAWRSYVARSPLEGMRAKSRAAVHLQLPDLLPSLEKITRSLVRFDEQKLRSHPRTFAFFNHGNYNLKETSIRLTPKTVLIFMLELRRR